MAHVLLLAQTTATSWWVALGPAAITGAVAVLVLHLTNRAADRRLEYEREMKLRDDRRAAYATMARVTKTLEATAPYDNADLGDAHAEIELLTDNASIRNVAGELVRAVIAARVVLWELEQSYTHNLYQTVQYQGANQRVEMERASFIRLARDDLAYEPKRSWWRRFFGFVRGTN